MNEDLTTNNSSIKMVDINTFVTSIVNKNIKKLLEKVNQMDKELKALKERMDHTEVNVVNNMESAVFMDKLTAEIRKRLKNGAD